MAGEQTIRRTAGLSGGGVNVSGAAAAGSSILCDAVISLQKSIPASTTDGEFDIAVDISVVSVMGLVCSQDATVKTNSSGAPDETISLSAGKPLIWESGVDPAASKFITHDITKLFITMVAAGTFKALFGVDSTPVLSG